MEASIWTAIFFREVSQEGRTEEGRTSSSAQELPFGTSYLQGDIPQKRWHGTYGTFFNYGTFNIVVIYYIVIVVFYYHYYNYYIYIYIYIS